MDPAVLTYFEGRELDLVILEVGDALPGKISAPVLVDARSKPYRVGAACTDFHALYALGLRDGFSRTLGAWIQKGRSGARLEGDLAEAVSGPGFEDRAQQRHESLESSLNKMSEHGRAAGFETSVRAGYVWLAVPGFSSSQIKRAFSENGLGVFACDHHPYRHRARLAPPGWAIVERLKLIFSASYKSLMSCE